MLTYFLKKILKSFFNAAVGIILFYTAHTLIGFVTNILFFLNIDIRTVISAIAAAILCAVSIFKLAKNDAQRDIAYHVYSIGWQLFTSLGAYGGAAALIWKVIKTENIALFFSFFTAFLFLIETAAYLWQGRNRKDQSRSPENDPED